MVKHTLSIGAQVAAIAFSASLLAGGKAAADVVIPDDLIVQGSACVGLDCVNNENFGFDTIRLKENNLRIKFEDTSVGAFPTNDWQILRATTPRAGAPASSRSRTAPARKTPFTITAGAATNSIFVDSTGQRGLPHLDAGARSACQHQQHAGDPAGAEQLRRLHRADLGHRRQRGQLLRARRDRRLAPAVPHPARARRPAASTFRPRATSASARRRRKPCKAA